jgi:hypothetical protein
MLEHFEYQKYRTNHNPSDRKENVKQINHWNVIRIVFHVSSFVFTFARSLNSSLGRVFSLHCAHGSFRQVAKLWGAGDR